MINSVMRQTQKETYMARTYAHKMVKGGHASVHTIVRNLDKGKLSLRDIVTLKVHAPDQPKVIQAIELSLESTKPYSMGNAGEGVELTGIALFEGQVETLRVTTYPTYHAAIVRKA